MIIIVDKIMHNQYEKKPMLQEYQDTNFHIHG